MCIVSTYTYAQLCMCIYNGVHYSTTCINVHVNMYSLLVYSTVISYDKINLTDSDHLSTTGLHASRLNTSIGSHD